MPSLFHRRRKITKKRITKIHKNKLVYQTVGNGLAK
jgi:hypothetical protein